MTAVRLEGKVVLVSGAASGMGAACAERISSAGAQVVAIDRDEPRLADLASRIGARPELVDLTEVAELPVVVERCVDDFGRVDALVNAAGIFQSRDLLEITPSEFDTMFAVNLRGLFFLQQAAARAMIAGGGGSIVNFASTAARVPRPVSSHYAATKAAVVSLTRSAAAALGPHGVRVNAVCPGVIRTPMIDAVLEEWAGMQGVSPEEVESSWCEMNPMGRLGTPAEVAEVVLFLIGDQSSYVTGESIGVNGGTDDI
ncbi:MAG TPA: SDR family NAD(P)-dependent oxidoreductase [Thermoleophilaceae bacterium]|nr:SDR family NAD(P)-dependent oxidoreductase [Thermoleophilaceae bacterium]